MKKILMALGALLITIPAVAQEDKQELPPYGQGWELINTGEYDDAIVHFTEMLGSEKSDSLYVSRGIAYFEKARKAGMEKYYTSAMEDVNAGRAVNPQNTDALLYRSRIKQELAKTKEPNEAILLLLNARSDLTIALDINPELEEAKKEIGRIDQTLPAIKNKK